MEIDDLMETAAMARLCINEQEMQKNLETFNGILAYLDIMQNYDGGEFNAALSARVVGSDHFRPDNVNWGGSNTDTGQKLVDKAPEKDGPFIVIPNVL